MKIKLEKLLLGNSNVFLVSSGNEIALIDGGLGDNSEKILDVARSMVDDFSGIKYSFITHAHYDHVGSIVGVKNLCDTQIVAQRNSVQNLRRGESPVPAGTMWFSKKISWLGCVLFRHCIKFRGFEADVVVEERREFPFSGGKITCYHLPGHTEGSMGVEIGDHFFAGDTLFHLLPGKVFPPFADDLPSLKNSWQKIVGLNCRFIWPGHGKKIAPALLNNCLKKDFVA
jgi:glyoxylase-like metal-dependent hydrolase (beta-lactamase superfamily II)